MSDIQVVARGRNTGRGSKVVWGVRAATESEAAATQQWPATA